LQLSFALLALCLLLHDILLSATPLRFLLERHLVLNFTLLVLTANLQIADEVFCLLGAWVVDAVEVFIKVFLIERLDLVA
jgi:hypothetical protein